MEKGLFNLAKARGQENKIFQSVSLLKSKSREFLCHEGARKGWGWGFPGAEREEVCAALVTDNILCSQTSGWRQLVAATLETFFPSAEQTHKFSLRPWDYSLLLDKEAVHQQHKITL